MPSEVSVIPSWQADRYRLRSSISTAATEAPRRPSTASASRLGLAGADERELGGHEEAVERVPAAPDGDQEERGHAG